MADAAFKSTEDSNAVQAHASSPGQRYQAWCRQRFSQLHQQLTPPQADFLSLLPRLLHSHFNGLPGLVNHQSPAGIVDFTPMPADADMFEIIDPGIYQLSAHPQAEEAVSGSPAIVSVLFEAAAYQLMPLLVADTLPVWIFHAADLPEAHLRLLHQKIESVQQLAAAMGWQMSAQLLPVGTDDNGLSDRLANRALLLAGAQPDWIPLSASTAQTPVVLLAPSSIADTTQLVCDATRSFDHYCFAPGQALHMWVWIEARIAGHRLALSIKDQLNQQLDTDDLLLFLDADCLMLKGVEAYLQSQGDTSRLQQVRQSVLEAVARQPHYQPFAEQLAARWQLTAFDSPATDAFATARDAMIQAASRVLGLLQQQTGKRAVQQQQALQQSVVQMQALYAPGNGKLVWQGEQVAANWQLIGDEGWQLRHDQQVLAHSQDLLQVLACAEFHGIGFEHITLADEKAKAAQSQVVVLFTALDRFFHQRLSQREVNAPSAAQRQDNALYVTVNLAKPATSLSGQALALAKMGASIFDGSGEQHLITGLSVLMESPQGEVICRRFDGPAALVNAVGYCVGHLARGASLENGLSPLLQPNVQVQCFEPGSADLIAGRVQQLITDLYGCFYQSRLGADARYVLQLGKQYYIVQLDDEQIRFKGARSEGELIQRLGVPRQTFSAVVVDQYAQLDPHFSAVCRQMVGGSIHVFYHCLDDASAMLYVVDEAGGIYRQRAEFRGEDTLLKPLDVFLQAIVQRRRHARLTAAQHSTAAASDDLPVAFYRLVDAGSGLPQAEPVALLTDGNYRPGMLVQAIGQLGSDGTLVFNIYCDQQLFLAADWGDELYPAVARFIMARRKSRERYACRLTDMDLSCLPANVDGSQAQTLDFLRYKMAIEDDINQALQRV